MYKGAYLSFSLRIKLIPIFYVLNITFLELILYVYGIFNNII